MRIFGIEPTWLQKLDKIRIDEKERTEVGASRPRRVSAAIDLDRVTTADNFASRRATALEFRYSMIETLKHRRNTSFE